MVEAVLGGEGLAQVAALASGAVGAPVAIVVPRLAATVVAGSEPDARTLEELGRYVGDRVRGRRVKTPDAVVAEAPIATGDDPVGAVLLLAGAGEPAADADEYLYIAAVASLT